MFLYRIISLFGYNKPFLSDISHSERIIEYGWIVKNLPDKGRILDIGCSGTMFPLQLASLGYKICGIDKIRITLRHSNLKFLQSDILDEPPLKTFDVITLISTLEHIGLNDDGDLKCMNILYDMLTDNGKLLITAPFGIAEQFPNYRVYDLARIERMWKGGVEKLEFFKEYSKDRWKEVSLEEASLVKMEQRGRVKAIFCGVFIKC